MKYFLEKWITILLASSIVFVSVLLAEAVVLTLTNQFKISFVYLALIPSFVLAAFFFTSVNKDIKLLPCVTSPALLLIFLISIILIFYPHDTFGGRDEAMYANYATHLVQTASLKIPSYLNNLPNDFVENVRITPPAYIIYLATQKVFFGVQGLLRGNVILIVFGLSSFFLVASFLGGNRIGLISTALFSSSMPFLWFSRETMSENLAFFLLWSSILFLFTFLKTKRGIYLIGLFLNTWLFALTRLEGFLIQFVILLMLPFILSRIKTLNIKKIFFIMFIYLFLVVSTLFIAKATFGHLIERLVPGVGMSIKSNIATFLPKKPSQGNIKSPVLERKYTHETLSNNFLIFYNEMLTKYNFLLMIFSIVIAACYFLIRLKKHNKVKLYFFIILLIILPESYKIIAPNVTIDQPWFYRRYMYALLPFGYICFLLFLNHLRIKRALVILSGGLFVINIILSGPILFLKNNWGLVDKMEEITKDISKKDFVIIENWTLGYYYPASFLIIQKEVRSAFMSTLTPPHFLPEKKLFNNAPYDKIVLLSTKERKDYPYFKIEKKDSVDVQYTQLVPSCQLNFLGMEKGLINPYDVGKLSISSVLKYCSQPKNESEKHKEKLYLYELIYRGSK